MTTMRAITDALLRLLRAIPLPLRREPFQRYCSGVPCPAMRRRLMRQIRTAWRETDD
jgi:hypothetical protein